jgi:hypothetical protein
MSSNSITPSTCKRDRSGEEACVWSLFLMPCKTYSTGTFVNKLTSNLRGSLRFESWYPVLILLSVLSSSRMSLYCQLEGSGSYGENLL